MGIAPVVFGSLVRGTQHSAVPGCGYLLAALLALLSVGVSYRRVLPCAGPVVAAVAAFGGCIIRVLFLASDLGWPGLYNYSYGGHIYYFYYYGCKKMLLIAKKRFYYSDT